jgi:hypothetical protein
MFRLWIALKLSRIVCGGNAKEVSQMGDVPKQLWNDIKQSIANVFERDMTPQEFYYLLSCYPYLTVCNAEYPYVDQGVKPTVTYAKNGWPILNFKTVIYAGSNALFAELRGKGKRETAAEGKKEDDEGGNGTIVKQFSDVAYEVMTLAHQLGWPTIEIISGFYPMQRMAWIAGLESNYSVTGFEPSIEDEVVRGWVTKLHQGKLYPTRLPIVPSTKPGR